MLTIIPIGVSKSLRKKRYSIKLQNKNPFHFKNKKIDIKENFIINFNLLPAITIHLIFKKIKFRK